MSLTECPNCSKTISDKAKICPHCKTSVSLIRCPECNAFADNKDKSCPNCGFQLKESIVDKIRNMKTYKKTSLILIVIFILASSLLFYNSYSKRQEAITLAKQDDILDDSTFTSVSITGKDIINMTDNIYEVLGWKSKKIDEITYYVSLEYVKKDNKNKIYLLAYEVNLNTKKVDFVNHSKGLIATYKSKGIIDNNYILEEYSSDDYNWRTKYNIN